MVEREFLQTIDSNSVSIDSDALLEYLDRAITQWRIRRDTPPEALVTAGKTVKEQLDEFERAGELAEMAPYYIDAYQSVRASVFGEVKP